MKTAPETSDLVEILQEVIFNETGVQLPAGDIATKVNVNEPYSQAKGHARIALKDCGALRGMFTSVQLEVLVCGDLEAIRIDREYRYTHPGGGRNGVTVSELYERQTRYGKTVLGSRRQ